MTKMQIIARLWSHIYDLLSIIEGKPLQPIDKVRRQIEKTEEYCIPYAEDASSVQ